MKRLILIIIILFASFSVSSETRTSPKTINQVIDHFQGLVQTYSKQKNYRLVFAKIYLETTLMIQQEIAKNEYRYPEWVEEAVVEFSKYYLRAIKGDLDGGPVAPAWKKCFEFNDKKYHKLSVQLLLAMNAHISNDLAFALSKTFDDGWDTIRVEKDYFKMMEMFETAIPKFIIHLRQMEKTLGIRKKGLKEYAILKIVSSMRENAWENALELHFASPWRREHLTKEIQLNALDLAEWIISGRFFIPAN